MILLMNLNNNICNSTTRATNIRILTMMIEPALVITITKKNKENIKFISNHKPKSKTNDLELVSDWAPGSEWVGGGGGRKAWSYAVQAKQCASSSGLVMIRKFLRLVIQMKN